MLGPLLWNIYYDGLIKLAMPTGTYLVGYADDVALVAVGRNKEQLKTRTTWALGRAIN